MDHQFKLMVVTVETAKRDYRKKTWYVISNAPGMLKGPKVGQVCSGPYAGSGPFDVATRARNIVAHELDGDEAVLTEGVGAKAVRG
ncbi:hypothetical protein SAY87_025926 [Trapa incisa]|uniref:Uncharacterized protein n=1 Tax=Trapa incisa TaxID=236973 RepID=A0AAN7JJJ1_9MYRT|nr:hypothetical protein SAY87_025926 [Trapa incisa]